MEAKNHLTEQNKTDILKSITSSGMDRTTTFRPMGIAGNVREATFKECCGDGKNVKKELVTEVERLLTNDAGYDVETKEVSNNGVKVVYFLLNGESTLSLCPPRLVDSKHMLIPNTTQAHSAFGLV